MILDVEKYQRLVESKIVSYVKLTTKKFFDTNPDMKACSLSESAEKLYNLVINNAVFNEEEFTEQDKNDVKNYVSCIQEQFNKVVNGDAKPVDLTVQEISNTINITQDEIEKCCMTSEDILKLIKEANEE
jgi:hypothetical protein